MTFTIALTAVAAFLSAAAIVILAILVAGIRSGDRAKNLTSAPRTRTEHLTRRLAQPPGHRRPRDPGRHPAAVEHAYRMAIEPDSTYAPTEPTRTLRSVDYVADRQIDLEAEP